MKPAPLRSLRAPAPLRCRPALALAAALVALLSAGCTTFCEETCEPLVFCAEGAPAGCGVPSTEDCVARCEAAIEEVPEQRREPVRACISCVAETSGGTVCDAALLQAELDTDCRAPCDDDDARQLAPAVLDALSAEALTGCSLDAPPEGA